MKTPTLVLSILVLHLLYGTGYTQPKNEAREWLNGVGEDYLKEATGNPSLYWELDNGGALKISDFSTSSEGKNKLIRKYTYLNLYELNTKESLLVDTSNFKGLILECRPEGKKCIKSRKYYNNSGFETQASASFLFKFKGAFDEQKVKRLEQELLIVIRKIKGSVRSN